MRDIFIEEVAVNSQYDKEKRKFNLLTFFCTLSFSLLVIWVLISLLYLISLIEGNLILKIIIIVLPMLFFCASGVVFLKIRYNYCVEYDYTLIDDSLRFAKVCRSIKRFDLIDFSTKDIEKIGKFGSQTYYDYFNNQNINAMLLTPNEQPFEGKDFFYVVANTNAEKVLIVIECTTNFISNILKTSNKRVLEADCK